jgi:hypothetical protein
VVSLSLETLVGFMAALNESNRLRKLTNAHLAEIALFSSVVSSLAYFVIRFKRSLAS